MRLETEFFFIFASLYLLVRLCIQLAVSFSLFFYYFHPKGLSPQTPPLSPARRNVCGSNIPPVRFFFPSLRETCPNVLGSKVLPPGVLAHWHHPLLLLPRGGGWMPSAAKKVFSPAPAFSPVGRRTASSVSTKNSAGGEVSSRCTYTTARRLHTHTHARTHSRQTDKIKTRKRTKKKKKTPVCVCVKLKEKSVSSAIRKTCKNSSRKKQKQKKKHNFVTPVCASVFVDYDSFVTRKNLCAAVVLNQRCVPRITHGSGESSGSNKIFPAVAVAPLGLVLKTRLHQSPERRKKKREFFFLSILTRHTIDVK